MNRHKHVRLRRKAPLSLRQLTTNAAVFVAAGVVLLVASLAGSAYMLALASAGTITGNASRVAVAGANGGTAIEFGAQIPSPSMPSSPTPTTGPTPSPSPAPTTTPSSGAPAMPTAVPSGFTRAFTEDFNTPAPLGSFDTVYGSDFDEYTGCCSTNGVTEYEPNQVLYVQNGSLYYDLHSSGGESMAAAPQPMQEKSFLYGQYGICVRLDSSNGPGYKIAFLLWPETNQWTNEVDFPEVDPDFTSPIRAVSLDTTTASGTHTFSGPLNTGYYLSDNKYHTFLLTWEPGSMTASIDGKVVETFPADSIPTQAMRMSMQAEGWINQGAVPASTTDVLEVPWVYINTYN